MNDPAELEVSEQERLVGLTPAQSRALTVLLSGATQSEAAEAAGVCRQRVCHWIHHDVKFRVTLKKEKLAALRSARTVLAAGALDAANYLRAVLTDPKADTNQKLKAASMLLTTSGVDQAPSPWPVLNDAEQMVSAELADVAAQHDHIERDRERLALEASRRRQFDPKEVAELEAHQQTIAAQIDVVDRQLRKLAVRRRLTAKQTAHQAQLEHQLAELEQQAATAENELLRHASLQRGLKDLEPRRSGLTRDPGGDAVFLQCLRSEAAHDG